MNREQFFKNLTVPKGKVDVVLDTDAYNEIDDQFAIGYMLGSSQKLRVKGICAAPFLNSKSTSPKDGMNKSYDEILKLLSLAASEFNMQQDIAAARVIFGSGVPLVQLPCCGVVDHFATTKYELQHWLKGKNPLCDYLCDNTISEADAYAHGKPWSRVIWDVTAVAWLLNDGSRFMKDRLIPSPIPEYDKHYACDERRHFIKYVYSINRDALFEDLFKVLGEQYENI